MFGSNKLRTLYLRRLFVSSVKAKVNKELFKMTNLLYLHHVGGNIT